MAKQEAKGEKKKKKKKKEVISGGRIYCEKLTAKTNY
jgi:hypothetical protein